MSKNNSKVSVLKFAVTPLPENKQLQGKDYVSWGKKNNFPDYLIDLYLKSARHNAIVNAKVDYIYGGGLTYDKKTINPVNEALSIAFINFFEQKKNCIKFILDGELFNGVCFEIIWNKKLTKPVEINYIPFNKIRANEDESLYFYSNDWSKVNQSEKETGYKIFKPFNSEKPEQSQLYVYQNKAPKKSGEPNVYPTPSYIGAMIAIETDIAVSNFDNSNLKSGFSAGTIINFNNGEPPTPEAKRDIESKVKERTTSADEAGNVIVSFNNGKDKETTVTTIAPSDLDKQNIEVDKRVEQRIFTAHKITNPALFGVRQDGTLSGDNNLGKDYELFQSIYVDGRQKWHEDVINELARYFGVATKIEFKRVAPVKDEVPSDMIKKVYDAYPIDQLADILGLPKPQKPITTQMNKNEEIDFVFSKYGRSKDLFDVVKKKEYTFTNNFSKHNFEDLTSIEKSILDLLSKDSTLGAPQLAKALKETEKNIILSIDNLANNGYLDIGNKGEVSITDSGNEILNTEKIKTENYEVVFGYDWRAGFDNSDISTSRDFCKNMLRKNLFYTEKELLSMENDLGTNVWEFGGGWRTKSDGSHVPTCRHLWHQYLVKLKK